MHSAVGAKIGVLIPGPLGLLFAFLSHFALDLIPEAYKGITTWFLALETVIFILAIACVFTFSINPWWMLLCGAVANIPDIIDTIYYKIKKKYIFPCHPTYGFKYQNWSMPIVINLFLDLFIVLLLLCR